MTFFQLIRITLDELYNQSVSEYVDEDALDHQVKEKMTYLSEKYENLYKNEQKPIDYRDPATRIAYVYGYVAAHADYIVRALKLLRSELGENIFQNETACVSCIGGGPGSDILAILKYLDETPEPVEKLTCYLLDKEQAWADTWSEVDDSLGGNLRLKTNFQSLDVTQPASEWTHRKHFLQADLFLLSYFVSEVYRFDNNGTVSGFWKYLFERMKPGALVLYIDNGKDLFNEYFDNMWEASGFECLLERTNERWTPRYSEQTADIQKYKDKFGGWSPKLKGYISLRVLRKKEV